MGSRVCRFWLKGNCRNGDSCNFDHPPVEQANNNRYAPLQNQPIARNRSPASQSSADRALPYQLDRAAVLADLTTEKPQWVLSAYGPGRWAPAQLFGGLPREQSFEEMRLQHYEGLASGTAAHKAQEALELFTKSNEQIETTIRNIDGAIRYVINSEKDHPNRLDICKASVGVEGGFNPSTTNPLHRGTWNSFGAPTYAPSSTQSHSATAFGRPSGLGQGQSAFDQPQNSFGASTQSAFGAPSNLGGQTQNTFGAPSQLGAPIQNAFGAPSQLGTFGRPSAALAQQPKPFGAPSSGASAPCSSFANNSTPFGQPSGQTTNPFGGNATPQPFGQPSGQISAPFGAPTFGNTPAAQNTFSTKPSNPFSAPPAPRNSFGPTSAQPPANVFGQPTGTANSNLAPQNQFGANGAHPPANPFSQPTNANPFANPLTNGALSTSNTLVTPASSGVVVGPTKKKTENVPNHPTLDTYAKVGPDNRTLQSFKGQPVTYKDGNPGIQGRNGWQRIWCPMGYPFRYGDTEMDEHFYDQSVADAYAPLMQTGSFLGGVMPMIPPKTEWCTFDF